MARLVVKNRHQNDTCENENGLCPLNLLTILGLVVSTIGEGLLHHFKRKRIFVLTSYNFCISTSIVKLDMRIFVICNSYTGVLISLSNRQLYLHKFFPIGSKNQLAKMLQKQNLKARHVVCS